MTCRDRNVFVGPNNAGKSTVLDALRLLADVARFAQNRLPVLKSQGSYGVCATYEISERNFSIPVSNIATNDSSNDVVVKIEHSNGAEINIILNLNRPPNVFIASDKQPKKTKQFFRSCFPENVIVVPTLGQLEHEEKPNDPDYVESIQHTRLAARNFRNIWKIKSHGEFETFAHLVESNWRKIEIQKPRVLFGTPTVLEMVYAEDGIAREVSMSGFGFQAWMQIMTHMMRGGANDILVLDEPDIYLHADLQRRLFHIARRRFGQIFLATHSAEIMNEANSGDVILVRPELQTGRRITTEEGYRAAHSLLGSSENADFARLSRAQRIIAFEGNDRAIYRRFEQLVVPDGVFGDPDTVMLKIGGFEQWPRVGNLPWAFEELFGIAPKIAALFDRDYRCLDDIVAHEQKLQESGILCRVLRRKEIENYAIRPEIVSQAILKMAEKRQVSLSEKRANETVNRIAEHMMEDALINAQSYASKFYALKRDKRDTKEILKMAKREFEHDVNVFGIWSRIGGKEFLSNLNNYLVEKYRFSISVYQIIDELNRENMDEELCGIIGEINKYFSE